MKLHGMDTKLPHLTDSRELILDSPFSWLVVSCVNKHTALKHFLRYMPSYEWMHRIAAHAIVAATGFKFHEAHMTHPLTQMTSSVPLEHSSWSFKTHRVILRSSPKNEFPISGIEHGGASATQPMTTHVSTPLLNQ